MSMCFRFLFGDCIVGGGEMMTVGWNEGMWFDFRFLEVLQLIKFDYRLVQLGKGCTPFSCLCLDLEAGYCLN